MANIRNGNTFFIDTAASSEATSDVSNLVVQNIRIKAIILVATSANAILTLEDVSTGNTKIEVRVAASGDSKYIDLTRNPIVFPNGISPATVTNARATVIVEESRG